jgi:PleD family two-component response regulator
MRILVGWDSADELETIQSFLNIGDNSAAVCSDAAAFSAAFNRNNFDVVLQALSFPSPTESFDLFQQFRRAHPDTPVVGAWRAGDINLLARFMMSGLQSSILRDQAGEYIMLLTTGLEAAHQAVLARRAQVLAEKLREEVESVRQLQESVIPHNLPAVGGLQGRRSLRAFANSGAR